LKRFFLWLVGIVIVLVGVIALAFHLSPWPSAFLIAQMFSGGDTASEAALEKHVPLGIAEKKDVAYGQGPDEIFDVYYPEGTASPLPAIVWVHGGGWIGGSKDGVANYLKILAGEGYTTVGVEYSTGIGSVYPKPVRQVNAALGYLVKNASSLNIDPRAISLAGDSAGAQITAQLAIITTDPSYAKRMDIVPELSPENLRAVLLLSGAYDLGAVDYNGDSAWFLKTVLWAYSGVKDFLNDEQFKLLSVTNYVTGAFPRAFISSGNGDPLEPQAEKLAKKLEGLGVGVDSLFFPSGYSPALPHEYQFNLENAAGQEALKRLIAFLKAGAGIQQ
jgi:acetyl esterase/lipase